MKNKENTINTKQNKNNIAIYLTYDIPTFEDIDLIRKTINLFGFVTLLMDRQANSIANKKYTLSYEERKEIILTDLQERNIINYNIIPIDTSFQDIILTKEFTALIFELTENGYKEKTLISIINSLVKIETIGIKLKENENTLTPKQLLKYDQSMQLFKQKYNTRDYSKFKIKNMTKIGINGKDKIKENILKEVLEEKGLMILDLDTIKENEKLQNLGKYLINSFENTVYIKSSDMYKNNFDKYMTKIIDLNEKDNIIEQAIKGINKDYRKPDYFIRGNTKDEIKNNTIFLINKLKNS